MAKRKPERWEEVTYKWQTFVVACLHSLADERLVEEEFESGRRASELRCQRRALRLAADKLLQERTSG